MKQILIFALFIFGFVQTSKAQIYFTFDSIANPPYICQAHVFDVEVFGHASSGIVQSTTQNYYVSQDTVYVEFHFGSGIGGPATPYPFHRNLVIPAPQNFGQYKIMAQGFYNGQLHKFLTSGISICSGMLAAPEPEKVNPTLLVFPNPAADRLQITLPKSNTGTTLTLADASGRIVRKFQVAAGISESQISLHALPAGLYLLQANSAAENFSQKIIKH